MKFILTILIILIIFGGFLLIKNSATKNPSSYPTTTVSPAVSITGPVGPVLCEPNELSGSITLDHAAGNVYGSLVLINIGKVPCNVVLGKSVTAIFNAKNMDVKYNSEPNPEEFTVQPNGKAYSQVHFPNGPQCQGPTSEQEVKFVYEEDEKTVAFKETGMNKDSILVQACSSAVDITTIDIWPLSKNPIGQ